MLAHFVAVADADAAGDSCVLASADEAANSVRDSAVVSGGLVKSLWQGIAVGLW